MFGLSLQEDVALRAEVLWQVGCGLDGDVNQSVLVGLFSTIQRLPPIVPWDVLLLLFWWGRSKGEGLYTVQADDVFPGTVGQDVYAWVPWHGAQVHVARDGGGRERMAQRRGARGGAGRVVVFTSGVVDAVWGDVYGEGSDRAL